uniref:Zinc finger CW-type and PWWP domain containing 2 n=1 Tax=Salvator merianae TaxID=96440 RepID=A0A8D0BXG9_SALMN
MDSTEYDIYLNKVWIQCENSSCLKWRLLSQDDTSCVDPNAPWYCYMNPDPWFNKCSISEEHFPEASQMQKHGLKYVYSKFPLGSLVLVKMHTWPSWPGILCPDPTNGHYMTYDADGDVESYHIEFLGKPHTRIWAPVKSINVCKRKKAWYASALEEAKELLACSVQQRLEMCCLSKKGTIIWPFDFVSETEILLKDLDQILKHVAVSCTPSIDFSIFTEKRPMEINTPEDCIIIDGKAFKAEECIENITDRFKEIDSLMAEFQQSL